MKNVGVMLALSALILASCGGVVAPSEDAPLADETEFAAEAQSQATYATFCRNESVPSNWRRTSTWVTTSRCFQGARFVDINSTSSVTICHNQSMPSSWRKTTGLKSPYPCGEFAVSWVNIRKDSEVTICHDQAMPSHWRKTTNLRRSYSCDAFEITWININKYNKVNICYPQSMPDPWVRTTSWTNRSACAGFGATFERR